MVQIGSGRVVAAWTAKRSARTFLDKRFNAGHILVAEGEFDVELIQHLLSEAPAGLTRASLAQRFHALCVAYDRLVDGYVQNLIDQGRVESRGGRLYAVCA